MESKEKYTEGREEEMRRDKYEDKEDQGKEENVIRRDKERRNRPWGERERGRNEERQIGR